MPTWLLFVVDIIIAYVSWVVASMVAGRVDFVGAGKLTGIFFVIGIGFLIFGIDAFLLALFIKLTISAFIMMPMWDVDDANSAFKILIVQGVMYLTLVMFFNMLTK